MAYIEERESDGAVIAEFTLPADSFAGGGADRPVTGVTWRPAGTAGEASDDRPLVCFGHGGSGDRNQQPIPWLAKRLVVEHGFGALVIDGPVHGRRQVGPGGREAFWPEWRREGTVEEMVADWRAALDFAQGEGGLGTGPVGYWGLSMGTIYGAPFVAAEPRIQAAVLGLMGISGPDHYRPSITAAAESVTIPVLFLMQLEDELFGRDECLALFDELASDDKRLHANPGLHPAVPMEELDHCVSFLAANLTGVTADRAAAFSVSE